MIHGLALVIGYIVLARWALLALMVTVASALAAARAWRTHHRYRRMWLEIERRMDLPTPTDDDVYGDGYGDGS